MQTNLKPLTEAQIEQYYRDGYIIAEQLVPHEIIDEVVSAAVSKQAISADGNWQHVSFDFNDHLKDFPIHKVLVDASIVAAVEQLFETEARAHYGMLAVVPAGGGKGLEWHADNQYTHILGKALNTFVALCDITPDKCNLWVAPGSHLKGLPESQVSGEQGEHKTIAFEPDNGMVLPTLKKGDACIFNRYTLHRSLHNTTNEDRYAYAAQYCEVTARLAETGKTTTRVLVKDLATEFSSAAANAAI